MVYPWDTDMTDQEEKELRDKIVAEISKRRLEQIALMILETHRPLSNVIGNALVVFTPFTAPFVGVDNVAAFSKLLSRPGAVQRLIDQVGEKMEEDPNPEEKAS